MTRLMRLSVIACVLMALAATAAFAAGGADLRRVVVFREGTSAQVQQEAIAQSGSRLLRMLALINGAAIELPSANTQAAMTSLGAHPAVSGVYDDPRIGAQGEAAAIAQGAGGDGAGGDGAGGDGAGGDGAGGDQVVFVTPVPSPAAEIYHWGVDRIGAPDVHEGSHPSRGEGVKVAVFDTGIDRTHPDLVPSLIGGFNAIAGADPRAYDDDNGHGTAMAGIIAARRNRAGVIGAAPRALLYAVKVLDKDGRGHTSDGIYALEVLAGREDIRIINMSYGTALVWPLFQVAVRRSYELGKIIVTSRGNGCTPATATAQGAGGDGAGGDGAGGDGAGGDGAGGDAGCQPYAIKYPAAYPEVIAVGATTATDKVAGYSLWGGVDVVAPGGDGTLKILTTNRGGGYGLIIGTSPSAAHVSGAVALALERQPKLSFERVVNVMQRTADHLGCPAWPATSAGCSIDHQGAGLIDVSAMLDALEQSPKTDD